ncbi:MAG TPA: peptide-methionine (S)-S-oxide reductase MsrA, partial [Polyangiaceae bacterium]
MKSKAALACMLLSGAALFACHGATSSASNDSTSTMTTSGNAQAAAGQAKVGGLAGHAGAGVALKADGSNQLAEFAAGCFWGVEDAFRHVPGVVATTVGYEGGHTQNPDYEDVCTHTTGHAETVLVEFDPAKVSYQKLVQVFFEIHDPTQVNRQGPDVGSNYRSVIFYFSPEQQKTAESEKMATASTLGKQVATEIVPQQP